MCCMGGSGRSSGSAGGRAHCCSPRTVVFVPMVIGNELGPEVDESPGGGKEGVPMAIGN